jgi:excisionase family DNA binding protein
VDDEQHNAPAAHHDFLTARQLAARLQVSEATVRRLARAGHIPAVRLTPRLIRFHLPSVLEALDGRADSRHARRRHAPPATDDAQLSFKDLL